MKVSLIEVFSKFLKVILPILVITDLTSILMSNLLLLNVSRGLRIILLFLFIIENIRHIRVITKFYFSKFLYLFALIHFFYLFTDRILIEAFWHFSKMLFWILGINVLYAYGYYNVLKLRDLVNVIKIMIIIALIFTFIYFSSGLLDSEYNVAAYLGVFIYPLLLFTSKGFTSNRISIILCSLIILVTLKRGAILAFLLSSMVYFLISMIMSYSSKKLLIGLFLIAIILGSGLYFTSLQRDRLKSRLSKEQFDLANDKAGSGRVGLYKKLYYEWRGSNNILFGFGNQADSYRWKSGLRTHAHSDILGYLYNYGLIGMSMILILYTYIIRFFLHFRSYDSEKGLIIIVFFLILILVNLYSGVLRNTETFYLFALLPYYQLTFEIQDIKD
jgi:hypothetical protein